MNTVRDAASEKLRRVIIEMTVDAKQRFNAFKTKEIEAISGFEVGGICKAKSGTDANAVKTMGERILKTC